MFSHATNSLLITSGRKSIKTSNTAVNLYVNGM